VGTATVLLDMMTQKMHSNFKIAGQKIGDHQDLDGLITKISSPGGRRHM